jgi:hypothetical protein
VVGGVNMTEPLIITPEIHQEFRDRIIAQTTREISKEFASNTAKSGVVLGALVGVYAMGDVFLTSKADTNAQISAASETRFNNAISGVEELLEDNPDTMSICMTVVEDACVVSQDFNVDTEAGVADFAIAAAATMTSEYGDVILKPEEAAVIRSSREDMVQEGTDTPTQETDAEIIQDLEQTANEYIAEIPLIEEQSTNEYTGEALIISPLLILSSIAIPLIARRMRNKRRRSIERTGDIVTDRLSDLAGHDSMSFSDYSSLQRALIYRSTSSKPFDRREQLETIQQLVDEINNKKRIKEVV